MRQHNGITSGFATGSITQDYREDVTYDGNGNILTYLRNGATAAGNQSMDNLTYNYSRDVSNRLVNNQLQYIHDAVTTSTTDLANQTSTTNYKYDPIGNLVQDAQNNITNVDWSVYGKIQNIYEPGGNINYTYDASANRVSKTAASLTTYYVRDAQGNPLAVYDNAGGNINWREQDLYGSSRLGIWKPNLVIPPNSTYTLNYSYGMAGWKLYELTNHLGNVMTTITDRRIQTSTTPTYGPDIATAQDYYPFGMLMPARQYSSNTYRFGFNGKENDNEVKGTGNQQDYGMRIYDPRVGRFLSVDPIAGSYPWYTPYQFAGNTPIEATDLDGLEPAHQEKSGRMIIGRDGGLAGGGVKLKPKIPDAVIRAKMRMAQTVAMADIYGNGFIGKRSYVEQQVADVKQQYTWTIGDNIRGGVFGAVGYYVGGDKGTFVGATIDGVLMSTASIKEPVFFGPKVETEFENTPTVYRVQGGVVPNASRERISVTANGSIDIKGDDMLHINIDDYSHAVYFFQKRGGSENGVSIVSFEIPESLVNEIKAKAVSQMQAKSFPDRPQIDDPTKSSSLYGLPKAYIEKLRQQAIQGTVKVTSE